MIHTRWLVPIFALVASGCVTAGPYRSAPVVVEPAEPVDVPPPPPAFIPGPEMGAPPLEARGYGDGQWVLTNQYGWVFMPYAQSYTYVPRTGTPYAYVFGRAFGWRWVSAAWVYGEGPAPRWGSRGVTRYVWYSHPWFPRRTVYVQPAPNRTYEGHREPPPPRVEERREERREEERREIRDDVRREERREEERRDVRQEERRDERRDIRQDERHEERKDDRKDQRRDQPKVRPLPPKPENEHEHDHEH